LSLDDLPGQDDPLKIIHGHITRVQFIIGVFAATPREAATGRDRKNEMSNV